MAENAVISPGGSVVYCEEAMKHFKEIGIVVYLHASYQTIKRRIRNPQKRGVVLKDGQTLKDLYDERKVLFEKYADVTISEEGVVIKGWFETAYDEKVRRNKWGRELYPKCMYDELMELKDKYGEFPIYVTENGHGCYDELVNGQIDDDERIEIMDEFIQWMLKAKERLKKIRKDLRKVDEDYHNRELELENYNWFGLFKYFKKRKI